MNPSFLRWALLVIALAGGAFIVVWNLLGERGASPAREVASRAAGSSQDDRAFAGPGAPQSAALPAQPSARLLFAFDRATLERAEAAKLARLAGEIKDAAFRRIDAIGHADRIGAEAYNLNLSRRRADAVKAYLVSLGIDADVVHTSAKGEAQPASGDGCIDMGPENRKNRALVECLQPDRRVDVAVLGGP